MAPTRVVREHPMYKEQAVLLHLKFTVTHCYQNKVT